MTNAGVGGLIKVLAVDQLLRLHFDTPLKFDAIAALEPKPHPCIIRRGHFETQIFNNGANAFDLLRVRRRQFAFTDVEACLLYTSPSPRDRQKSRMPSSA